MAKQTHSDADYINLKQQYDSLLEKNQSDLIKIKQKEKSLNVACQLCRKLSKKSRRSMKTGKLGSSSG